MSRLQVTHFASNTRLKRPGYVYDDNGIGYPVDAQPSINWKHVDGPLLVCRNGYIQWLTWWDRFQYWRGIDSAETLEAKVAWTRARLRQRMIRANTRRHR